MANEASEVEEYINGVTPEKRRRDARTLLELMGRITGETPFLWGTIIGFGNYHYRYESGREGDAGAAGFAPRKAAMVIYLPDGVGAHEAELEHLGEHTSGVSCLYVKDLDKTDLNVLEAVIAESYRSVTTHGITARVGGHGAAAKS